LNFDNLVLDDMTHSMRILEVGLLDIYTQFPARHDY